MEHYQSTITHGQNILSGIETQWNIDVDTRTLAVHAAVAATAAGLVVQEKWRSYLYI